MSINKFEDLTNSHKEIQINKTNHKNNLKQYLMSNKHFNKEESRSGKFSWFPKTVTVLGVSAVVATGLYYASPSTSTTQSVLASAEQAYTQKSEQEGRYYYAKQKITLYGMGEGGQKEVWTEEIWEDTEEDNFRTKITNEKGEKVDEFAYIKGKEYQCVDCSADMPGVIIDEDFYVDEFETAFDYITDSQWESLSMAEINSLMENNGDEPVFEKEDPLYNMKPSDIEKLSDEEWIEIEKKYEDIYSGELMFVDDLTSEFDYITDSQWESLSMAEINSLMESNGDEPVFEKEDPLYNMKPSDIEKLSDEEWEEFDEQYMNLYGDEVEIFETGYDDFAELEVLEGEYSEALSQAWDLQDNKDKASRTEMFNELKSNDSVKELGKSTFAGKKVEGLEIVDTMFEDEFKTIFYFDADNYEFVGSEDYIKEGDKYELISSIETLEQGYSNDSINVNIEGLEEIDFDAESMIISDVSFDAVKVY